MTPTTRLLALLALLAIAPLATAQENDDCLMCHGDAEATRDDGTSIAVAPETFEASIHGQAGLSCTDCHADLAGVELPHEVPLETVDCSACHDDVAAEYARGIHATARAANADSLAAGCTDCHGTHDILPSSDPDSRTYHLNVPTTCARCHADADTIEKAHIAIGNVPELYEDSIHGRGLKDLGLLVAPNCATCHGAHDVRPASDTGSRVSRAHIPSTCGSCHGGIERKYAEGVHGSALAAGNDKAAVCSDCHTAHGIQETNLPPWKLDVIRECGNCHEQSLHTYRDTFHGQVTSLGFSRVAGCADCHGAHDIFPETDPRSTVSPQRRVETCSRCHPGANENFVRYDPHANPRDAERNPTLHYASRFMQLLLVGVFAFFGLHTALWLPRSYRERRRRPPRPPRPSPVEDQGSDR